MITTANLAALFAGGLLGWLAGIVVGLTIARAMNAERPRDRLAKVKGF